MRSLEKINNLNWHEYFRTTIDHSDFFIDKIQKTYTEEYKFANACDKKREDFKINIIHYKIFRYFCWRKKI